MRNYNDLVKQNKWTEQVSQGQWTKTFGKEILGQWGSRWQDQMCWHSSDTWLIRGSCPSWVSGRTAAILTDSCGLHQCLQAYTRIRTQLISIMHLSSYHLTLYILASEILVNEPTKEETAVLCHHSAQFLTAWNKSMSLESLRHLALSSSTVSL